MKAIVCEMCGSQEFAKTDGMYVCQHCGTKYDPEEAKKLLIEVSGSVEIDNSKKLENLYKLARRAKDDGNSEDAANYYSQIAIEAPDDWEAQFYKVLFTCKQTKIANMGNSCVKLGNCIQNVYSLIDKCISDKKENLSCKVKVSSECLNFGTLISQNLTNIMKNSGYDENFRREVSAGLCMLSFKMGMAEKSSGHEIMKFTSLEYFKKALLYAEVSKADANVINAIQQQIKALDPNYQIPKKQTSSEGCYIATAVYGSYDCPQVWTLRRYRDYTLAQTWYGRTFIRTYYAISPTLVKWFGHTNWFRNMWKPRLDKMVRKLNDKGVSDTPYQDKKW